MLFGLGQSEGRCLALGEDQEGEGRLVKNKPDLEHTISFYSLY